MKQFLFGYYVEQEAHDPFNYVFYLNKFRCQFNDPARGLTALLTTIDIANKDLREASRGPRDMGYKVVFEIRKSLIMLQIPKAYPNLLEVMKIEHKGVLRKMETRDFLKSLGD